MWPEALNGKGNPVRNTKAERPVCVQQDFMHMPCPSQPCKQHPTIGSPATGTPKPTLQSLISLMWSFLGCGIRNTCLCLWQWCLPLVSGFGLGHVCRCTGELHSFQYVPNWMWSHSVTLGSSDCTWPKHRTGSSVLARNHFLFPRCLPSLWFWWPRHSPGELQGLLASMAFA